MLDSARSVMSEDVLTVYDDARVGEVIDLLQARRISGVPVLHRKDPTSGGHDAVVGVVSGTDIRRLAAHSQPGEANGRGFYLDDRSGPYLRGLDLGAVRDVAVREVMSTSLVTVAADDPIRVCAQRMVERRVHRVLVTSGTELQGIVSSTDLLRLVAERRLQTPQADISPTQSGAGEEAK